MEYDTRPGKRVRLYRNNKRDGSHDFAITFMEIKTFGT